MKIKLFGIVAYCMLALSCQKSLEKTHSADEQLKSKSALSAFSVTCPPTVLSGTISTNTTLSASTAYLLRGNVVIDGATLTIPAGTVIMGEKSTNGALIVKPNAQISAIGTVNNPIIFTSDQLPGTRAAGDWFGVAILGDAPNNRSNSLSLTINSTSFTAGGTNTTSSAGRFEYVQLNYAGAGGGIGSDVLTESALILGSIGSGMTIHNIQISNSKNDGLGIWGGEVGIKEVFTHKSLGIEIRNSQGYRGNMQSLLAFKDDAVAVATNIPTLEITNHLIGTTSVLQTYPTISNATLLGGTYCENSDTEYNRGIVISQDASAKIYNSVVEGFADYGLFLADANIVSKTQTGGNQLIFSYNSIENIGLSDYIANIALPTTWASAGGCNSTPSSTMQNWIEGTTGVACQQNGNQFGFGTTGYYSNSLCNSDKCTYFPNLYINTSTTALDDPDYSDLSGFFDQLLYRGALQSSTDTWLKNTWIDFCIQKNYCL